MRLATIDIVVVAIYAIGIFALAQWVSRRKTAGDRSATDYFLASRELPWWAIGASLIAANISAEQIIGMSGSGFAIGLAIASYEWMAALTLLIVGKYFLPIFLRNDIFTMPQFLEQRYGATLRTLMAVFWLGLYIFVNLTSIIWLGSIAVTEIAGVDQDVALVVLGAFALLYQLGGGLRAVAFTDIVQVTLLVVGGLVVTGLALNEIGEGDGPIAGFIALAEVMPTHFDMILSPNNPFYADLPGIGVIVGGMWIANLSYWGFNQYIIQRALAAKSIKEAQRGVVFAAYLKLLMPLIIVVPGIAAAMLHPDLARPDEAYPAMMALLPAGLLGLVFAALVAAIIASTASKINSVATIFALDLYARFAKPRSGEHVIRIGQAAAIVATIIAVLTARPLLGGFDQAFQFIQEYTGFFTPGIVVIFLLGLFWPRATEAGALSAAIGSFVLSLGLKWVAPSLPFLDRMGLVFLAALFFAVIVSYGTPARAGQNSIRTDDVDFKTSGGFNIAAVGVVLILVALYAIWW